ncbi:hypothetical protein Q3O60_05045 [Alkalimonas collagenimarina]|uniref:Uncharacterized protein n=1 Tax=Alkalimonas collagenimarina TaxID=400390 RepID=A0ABT9GWV7_9GAMM|nr:hypothetical protein [Alkalimonas collagenimarina]MDP4535551.1 hypothetical protein [Alkalimonas collagenimarina]
MALKESAVSQSKPKASSKQKNRHNGKIRRNKREKKDVFSMQNPKLMFEVLLFAYWPPNRVSLAYQNLLTTKKQTNELIDKQAGNAECSENKRTRSQPKKMIDLQRQNPFNTTPLPR